MGPILWMHIGMGCLRDARFNAASHRRSRGKHHSHGCGHGHHGHHRSVVSLHGKTVPGFGRGIHLRQKGAWLRSRILVRLVARVGLHRHHLGERDRSRAHRPLSVRPGLSSGLSLHRGWLRRVPWRGAAVRVPRGRVLRRGGRRRDAGDGALDRRSHRRHRQLHAR